MTIKIDGNMVDVYIEHKIGNKNTYLRIKNDLCLYVTTSKFVSDSEILKIINDNINSVANMYKKQVNKNNINSSFMYLGKSYEVVYTNINDVTLLDNRVLVGKDIDLDKWYKRKSEDLFLERLKFWYDNFNRSIPYPKLRIRKMTSRWGVCNFKDNIVTLNLELMKKDIECLDYVIVHELSHFIEHNHSVSFWRVVGENYPNYKNVRRKMKNY